MRYAIYGAGSLGTVLGAFITKAGTDIDLISRNKEHVQALNESLHLNSLVFSYPDCFDPKGIHERPS